MTGDILTFWMMIVIVMYLDCLADDSDSYYLNLLADDSDSDVS